MKKLILIVILAAFLWSCKKETPEIAEKSSPLQTILVQLRNSMPLSQLESLDTSTAYLTALGAYNYFRIPVIGKGI